MSPSFAIIAGVGPGVGAALARRFAKGGLGVAMIARDTLRLDALAASIRAAGGVVVPYAADLSDHESIREVIASILADHGRPVALVWNAAVWDETPALTLDPAAFDRQMRLGLTGAVTALQAVAPAMTAGGGGSILLTGGGLALAPEHGGPVPALTAVKSALRGFVHASAPALAAQGLRLGTVTIAGRVVPGTAFDPDNIAEAFWRLHSDPDPRIEKVFDGS